VFGPFGRASAYVLKQSDIENLDIAIGKLVQGEKYLSPVISRTWTDRYRLKNNKPPLTS
jgi:DNA-binding NarL/FixJ family response regulator